MDKTPLEVSSSTIGADCGPKTPKDVMMSTRYAAEQNKNIPKNITLFTQIECQENFGLSFSVTHSVGCDVN